MPGCSLTQFKHQWHIHSYHISSQILPKSPAPTSLWATAYFLVRSEDWVESSASSSWISVLFLLNTSVLRSLPSSRLFLKCQLQSKHSWSEVASQFTPPSPPAVILSSSHRLPVLCGGLFFFSIVFLSLRIEETQVELCHLSLFRALAMLEHSPWYLVEFSNYSPSMPRSPGLLSFGHILNCQEESSSAMSHPHNPNRGTCPECYIHFLWQISQI